MSAAMERFTTFETDLGVCAMAFGERGVRALKLPHANLRGAEEALRADLPGVVPGTPSREIRAVVRRVGAHLRGSREDFRNVAIDLRACPPFHQKVYAAAREVRTGFTATYGDLAAWAGSPGASRAVGQAMAQNPISVIIPCHRIVGSSGLGGFSAQGGLSTKERLLSLEGVWLSRAWESAEAEAVLRRSDPKLGKLMDRVGSFTLRRSLQKTPFEALVRSIVYQQLHGKAAATIHARLAALFPRGRIAPRALLQMDSQQLRGAGLSQNKYLALRDLSEKAEEGLVPSVWRGLMQLSDEAIIERLTQVRGVGRWTVEMLLIFRMLRPDVMPVDDFAIRKAFGQLYGVRGSVLPKHVLEYSERWRPFRTVASWYLWRSLDTATL